MEKIYGSGNALRKEKQAEVRRKTARMEFGVLSTDGDSHRASLDRNHDLRLPTPQYNNTLTVRSWQRPARESGIPQHKREGSLSLVYRAEGSPQE